MTGTSHLTIGLVAAIGVFVKKAGGFSLFALVLNISLLLVGSLLPDIDGGGKITRVTGRFTSLVVSRVVAHRGGLHSLCVPCLCVISGYLMHTSFFFLGAGYMLHIAADSLTVAGVPLLWPLSKKRFGLRLVKTGSPMELVLVVLICFTSLWCLLSTSADYKILNDLLDSFLTTLKKSSLF